MKKMWICPYCGGETKPISINEVCEDIREDILKEIRKKESPVIVKCKSCDKIWVDEF